MSRVAVMGDKTSVLGFKALGLDTYALARVEEAEQVWRSLQEKDYSIIFVTEQAYQEIEKEIESLMALTPVVVIIPSTTGSIGLAKARMKRIVEKAVGVDIMFQEGEG